MHSLMGSNMRTCCPTAYVVQEKEGGGRDMHPVTANPKKRRDKLQYVDGLVKEPSE